VEAGVREASRCAQVALAQAASLPSIGCPIEAAALTSFFAHRDESVDVALGAVEQGISLFQDFESLKQGVRIEF
jgi:hypothetical protein